MTRQLFVFLRLFSYCHLLITTRFFQYQFEENYSFNLTMYLLSVPLITVAFQCSVCIKVTRRLIRLRRLWACFVIFSVWNQLEDRDMVIPLKFHLHFFYFGYSRWSLLKYCPSVTLLRCSVSRIRILTIRIVWIFRYGTDMNKLCVPVIV